MRSPLYVNFISSCSCLHKSSFRYPAQNNEELFCTFFRIADISFNINFFTTSFFEITASMLDVSLEPLLLFKFDRFLEFGRRKWRETSVHRLHHFFLRTESAPVEVLFQSWEQPEITWHKVRWAGQKWNNASRYSLINEAVCGLTLSWWRW